MPETNRQIILTSRPQGWVSEDNFALQDAALSEPEDGDVLVRNIYLSLDPYMRGRMNDAKSYAKPFALDAVLQARVIGEVAASRHPDYREGDIVFGMLGWEAFSLAPGAEGLRPIDPKLASLPHYLGALGMPGMTAWIGMLEIGEPEPGETVLVSAASGAVGQIAGQIGKIMGCRVVGSAGSDAKATYVVDELGFDSSFNYKVESNFVNILNQQCLDGIDVYFDNVGGKMLEAALECANPFARFIECGMISQYNLAQPEGIHNLTWLTRKRIKMQGFIVSDRVERLDEFLAQVGAWINEGRINYRTDIAQGLENAPAAFIAMLKGDNFGKQIVQIGPEP